MEPATLNQTIAPPPSLLSNSAPAHVISVLSSISKPPSSPSSPRARASVMNISSASSSPTLSRGGSQIIVTDLVSARAALNPVGLPIEKTSSSSPFASSSSSPSSSSSSSPTASRHVSSPRFNTPSSPVFPKPLRPPNSTQLPTPPSSIAPIESYTSESIKKDDLNGQNIEQADDLGRKQASPIKSPHPSAFVARSASASSLDVPSTISTLSLSTPSLLKPSSSSLSSSQETTNWTACKPLMTNEPSANLLHRNKRHLLSRPMSAIGFVRAGVLPSTPDSAGSSITQFSNDDVRSRSPSPFHPAPILSASPTVPRIPTSPLAAPVSSSSTAASSMASSLGSSFGTSPVSFGTHSNCSSASSSPQTSSFDLRAAAANVVAQSSPSVESIRPFISAIVLDHNSRRSIESIPSFNGSPRDSPCESPCESPRPTEITPERASESPRWTEESASASGWRSPSLSPSTSSTNLSALSPTFRANRASMYNLHRINRGATSMDFSLSSPRASPDILALSPNMQGRIRGDSAGRAQDTTATEVTGRPREGSASGRPREGSIGGRPREGSASGRPREGSIGGRSREGSGASASPVRSVSDPFVGESGRSNSFDKEDPTQQPQYPFAILT